VGDGASPVVRRVLIVDDYQDAADLLAEAIRARGYEARTAFDGPTALAAAIEFRPDVVLLDIGLPAMDGYEVARRLRALVDGAAMFLVAVTGYGQRGDELLSSEAGFDVHVVKPIELSALEPLLGRAGRRDQSSRG
jgi:CheY-like chemotaxis protein